MFVINKMDSKNKDDEDDVRSISLDMFKEEGRKCVRTKDDDIYIAALYLFEEEAHENVRTKERYEENKKIREKLVEYYKEYDKEYDNLKIQKYYIGWHIKVFIERIDRANLEYELKCEINEMDSKEKEESLIFMDAVNLFEKEFCENVCTREQYEHNKKVIAKLVEYDNLNIQKLNYRQYIKTFIKKIDEANWRYEMEYEIR